LEVRALNGRQQAAAAGATDELNRLIEMAADAPVAFNRKLHQLYAWCQAPDQCFRPWIWEVGQGRRVHPDKFNIGRIAFEHNVNPNYSEAINFGYLDVGDLDLTGYGPIKIRFRSDAISRRTTFLETNAYYFCHTHGVVDPTLMPIGYRSLWGERGVLAAAKLGEKVRTGMSDADLRWLLIHEGGAAGSEDFLEAHIYNDLHISAIESIRGPKPSSDQQAMWDYVCSTLTAVGAQVKERT
jgi:hypothetical protein